MKTIDIRTMKKRVKKGPSKSLKKAVEHFTSHKNGDFLMMSPDKLLPDPDQPRKTFNDDTILELAESIESHGMLQPILVRFTDGEFYIVAGERRYRAASAAGLKSVPCLVTTGDKEEISLIENVQREDLTHMELADAIKKMMDRYNYSQTQVGKIIKKSQDTVSQILSINRLPDEVKEDLLKTPDAGAKISRRTLVEIAKEPEPVAKDLYKAAKEGATSDEIRMKRGNKGKVTFKVRPKDVIFREKIDNLILLLKEVDDPGRLPFPTRKCIRNLKTELKRFPAK